MAAYIHNIRIDSLHAIKNLSIDLRPAPDERQPFRHLILTGPNGSGKSTALKFIAECIDGGSADGEIQWSEPWSSATVVAYIPTHRELQFQPVRGVTKIKLPRPVRVSQNLSRLLLQHLVNRTAEQAFAGADGDRAREAAVKAWFDGFQDTLRWLFEDPKLTLAFDSRRFDFEIHRGDGSSHGLRVLADGHAAFLAIFADIILAIERVQEFYAADSPEPVTPAGVVILDEIENHLHLRLQEQALPFLTQLFPHFQFITATHSPAVIASVPNAVVYDMAARTATSSAEFVGVRYGALMTGHFHLSSEFDLDSTNKLAELKRLAADGSAPFRLQELADELSRRSATLRYEVWRVLHEPALAESAE